MHNLSRKKLGVFISVVEAGSFTKGSYCSNISQPATISIINEIEATIGAELFERSGKTRSAKVTPRGREVYDILVKALAVYDQVLARLDSKKKPCVPKVLIQTPYASAVSSNWLCSLVSKFEGSQMKIRSAGRNEIFSAIEDREECMAFIDGDIRPKNSEYFPVGTSEVVLVASHSRTEHFDFGPGNIAWQDVPRNTVLYSGTAPDVLRNIYEKLKVIGVNRGELTEINCAEILRHFIFDLGRPALLPRIMAKTLHQEMDFQSFQFSYTPVHVTLGLVVPYGQNSLFKLSRSDIQQAFPLGQ